MKSGEKPVTSNRASLLEKGDERRSSASKKRKVRRERERDSRGRGKEYKKDGRKCHIFIDKYHLFKVTNTCIYEILNYVKFHHNHYMYRF